MDRRFQQTTQQLLKLKPDELPSIWFAIIYRRLRSSIPMRLAVLTLLLSLPLLASIDHFDVSTILIALAAGYALAVNVILIRRMFKRTIKSIAPSM